MEFMKGEKKAYFDEAFAWLMDDENFDFGPFFDGLEDLKEEKQRFRDEKWGEDFDDDTSEGTSEGTCESTVEKSWALEPKAILS